MSIHLDKAVRLRELRARLQTLERGASGAMPPLAFGLPALDAHLGGGLPRGCLHEVAGAAEDGAALGFCAVLAGRLAAERPVLWCQPAFDLYAPGLAAFGLEPARLIVVSARRPADRLWAIEEGLRCKALSAALIELDDLDLTAGRRLQLAAEAGGVTGFVLNSPSPAQRGRVGVGAVTRWQVTSTAGHGVHRSFFGGQTAEDRGQAIGTVRPPSSVVRPLSAGHGVHRSFSPRPLDGQGKWLGPSYWQVELRRCRGGRPGRWLIEWTEGGWRDATGDVAVAAALRDRTHPPAARA